MIKIDFEFDSKYGIFRDALYLADDHTHTESEIEQMKKERFDTWVYSINNPAPQTPQPYVFLNKRIYKKIQIDGETVLAPIETTDKPNFTQPVEEVINNG